MNNHLIKRQTDILGNMTDAVSLTLLLYHVLHKIYET